MENIGRSQQQQQDQQIRVALMNEQSRNQKKKKKYKVKIDNDLPQANQICQNAEQKARPPIGQIVNLNDNARQPIQQQPKIQADKLNVKKIEILVFCTILILGFLSVTQEIAGEEQQPQQLQITQQWKKQSAMLKEKINSLQQRLDQFSKQQQFKQIERKKQIEYLQKKVQFMLQSFNELKIYSQKLQKEIKDIHLSQLSKTEKSFNSLMKFSKHFYFKIKQNQQFKNSYIQKIYNNTVKIFKKDDEETIAYSEETIQDQKISHFRIKIIRTQLGLLSIGVFTSNKDNSCGYCKGSKMYYIYGKDGQIYHIHSSQTNFESIKNGDIVTVFISMEEKAIIWYINSKYAGTYYLKGMDYHEKLRPFILMITPNDQMEILPS